MLFDNALGYPYLKRFKFEASARPQRFVGGDEGGSILLLTDRQHARLLLTFGGADEVRPQVEVDADTFIGIKSFKAKGKRLTQYNLASVADITPEPEPESEPEPEAPQEEPESPQPESGCGEPAGEPQIAPEPHSPEQPSLFDEID